MTDASTDDASPSTLFPAHKTQYLPFHHIPITNNVAAHLTACIHMTDTQAHPRPLRFRHTSNCMYTHDLWSTGMHLRIPIDSIPGANIRHHHTSVTHLEQAISLVKCKNVSRLIGCAAIYFSCLGRKYNIGLGRKCLTFNIVTRNFWADKLCSKIS